MTLGLGSISVSVSFCSFFLSPSSITMSAVVLVVMVVCMVVPDGVVSVVVVVSVVSVVVAVVSAVSVVLGGLVFLVCFFLACERAACTCFTFCCALLIKNLSMSTPTI